MKLPPTSLAAALHYVEYGWPVFPCKPWPDKSPYTRHGWQDATTDPRKVETLWRHWPNAEIGMPTGKPSGRNVFDIDAKPARPAKGSRPAQPLTFGFDTLTALGFVLPSTPMVHTPGDPGGLGSGLHLHFSADGPSIRGTTGKRGRGIGVGLDWRGDGNYVILPSTLTPGPDPECRPTYWWDPVYGPDTPLAAIPSELLPREPERIVREPVEPADGLSPYARAALNGACRAIVAAPNGEQEATLNSESFAIGTLAGAGGIPETFALKTLLWAASRIHDYDTRHPWRAKDLEDKVKRAFADGLSHPREGRRHG
jgi:hypothetical protein